ncbi:U3 small nucleolar RNA-associated protein 15 homolog [Portunus trituberculatus]|uniref:U3 small nucleolar RNA-associated protein 15 homolog n=1 Tax=Portunus trituberculatus TaxID=210409 RepID=A0A5B7E947_PORTR|nr:U3 small nucleolar RNA-associated protein 15 homolog [Portunus trituberculatus]MPC29304.1 U3 small nucleolar RNA-associated protein 15 [Portunus trituberculatus]
MASFKRTHTRGYSRAAAKTTSDTLYWRKLEFPVTVKEFTAINSVDVSPAEPHYIAVTSGPKIDVYHRETTQVWRTISRFQRLAYGGRFRQDGQLLLAGSEEGAIKLFNHRQKQLLRIFKGHEGPTHRVDFIQGVPQIVSFSDDKTGVVWDMTNEDKLCTLSGHTDFIRTGLASPASQHIILTGSYDHTVRLWDTRTSSSVLTVDHGAPVESLVCFPSGGVFVSSGGCEVKVWDAISGRLLSKVSQHHKTITCLALASNQKRLLSGSLDRHIKIYDVDTYSVVHTLTYPAPILCMAVAPEDATLAVGMIAAGSGLMSFQHRRSPEVSTHQVAKEAGAKANIRNTISDDYRTLSDDHIVPSMTTEKMAKYDKMICKFEYSRALDAVMLSFIANKCTSISVGVLQELIRRGGIRTAVAGRDVKKLTPLLSFLIKNIRHPAYKPVLMDVANVVIDVYGDTLDENPQLVRHFQRLKEEVAAELQLIVEHSALMGAIQMFLTTSNPHLNTSLVSVQQLATTECSSTPARMLHPSSSAKSASNLVVDVN